MIMVGRKATFLEVSGDDLPSIFVICQYGIYRGYGEDTQKYEHESYW